MKTKIIIGGLLAVLMLVIVPFLIGALTESTAEATTWEDTPLEEITSEDPSVEETPSQDTTSKTLTKEKTIPEDTTNEETTPQQTKYYRFGFIQAFFSGLYDEDVDCTHGLVFKHDIVITSTSGTLKTPLKINGETIVESNTPVTLKIEHMGPIGFRLTMAGFTDWTYTLHVGISGFAMGITVTY